MKKNKFNEEIRNNEELDLKNLSDEELDKMAYNEEPYLAEQADIQKLEELMNESYRNINELDRLDEVLENGEKVKEELNRLKKLDIENETAINQAYLKQEENLKDPNFNSLPPEEKLLKDPTFSIADFSIRYNKLYSKTESIRCNFFKKVFKDYVKIVPDDDYKTFLKSVGYEFFMKNVDDKNFAKKDLEFQDFSVNQVINMGKDALPETFERLAKTGFGNSRAEINFLKFANKRAKEEQEKQIKEISKILDQNALQTADNYKMTCTMLMRKYAFWFASEC